MFVILFDPKLNPQFRSRFSSFDFCLLSIKAKAEKNFKYFVAASLRYWIKL